MIFDVLKIGEKKMNQLQETTDYDFYYIYYIVTIIINLPVSSKGGKILIPFSLNFYFFFPLPKYDINNIINYYNS